MTTAWFAGWRCGCTTLEPTRDEVAQACPEHAASLIAQADAVQLDSVSRLGRWTAAKHDEYDAQQSA